jgi:hypothetical protein
MKVDTFISLTSFEKVGVFFTRSEMKVDTFISLTSFENKKTGGWSVTSAGLPLSGDLL